LTPSLVFRRLGRTDALAFHDPYYLAAQHQIEAMASLVPELPPDEKIGFIFDWRSLDTFVNMGEIISAMRQSETLTFTKRIAGVGFYSSTDHVGIQAADMLAYEVRRNFWEVVFPANPAPIRWQWEALRPMNVRFFNRDALAKL
jgi:hypothetical protein